MDWNNDGRKDLLIGEGDGQVRIYLNTGTDAGPVFSGYSQLRVAGTNFDCVCSAVPWVTDWNNDGRKDVLCGEQAGRVRLMLNTGTEGSPVFANWVYLTNGTSILSVGYDSSPVVVDWNRDGKKDLVVGCEAGTLYYFENKGTDANPAFNGYELFRAGEATMDVTNNCHPVVCDWDNDGRWDVISGAYELTAATHVWYFHAPNGPYLSLYSTAGANFEPGTYVNLTCTLRNGGGLVTNVVASLSSSSPWCRVVSSSEWAAGDMPTNSTRNNASSPFRLWIETNALLGVELPLYLAISGNGGAYRQTNQLRFNVPQPSLSLVDCFVNDSQGNGNCALEPGESAQLIVRLKNSGYRAQNVTARLYYAYGISVTHSNSCFGTIERNATNSNALLPFGLTALSNVPALPYFYIDVTCDRATFTNSLYYRVQPTYARSNGVSFAWIDTSGGTNLTLANDGYRSVSLPSSFYCKLYEYSFSSLYVFADGYLSPYSSGSPTNTGIPKTPYPYGIIAPFWDDLDPAAGGTVRYKFFGTTPNRYFVAEWNNVPRRNDSATHVTVQAVLYENGDIKFQYGASTGTSADGRSATIGIEDYYGTKGVQYAFNQVGAVSNGLALYFRYAACSEDLDGDGLPDAFEQFYFGNLGRSGTQDSDGDGVTDLNEFRAGTDPTQAASRLRIDEFRLLSPTQGLLCWQSIPGKPYTVWLGGAAVTQPALSLGPCLSGVRPRIHIEAQATLPYVLYSASNLYYWTALHTNLTGGPMDFLDAQAATCPCRFYRACVVSQNGWARLTAAPVIGAASGTNYYTNAILPAAGLLRLSTP